MDNINDINSYNSLTMSLNNKKELRTSTSYSSTKKNITNEFDQTLKNFDINSFKRVSIEIHNNIQRTSINIDKAFTNTQNISTKDEDSSSSTLTKLPKIQNHINSSTLNGQQNLTTNNFFLNENNSTKNLGKKVFSSINDISSSNTNGGMHSNSKIPNSTKYRSSYMGSANRIYGNHYYKSKNYDSLLSPPDP